MSVEFVGHEGDVILSEQIMATLALLDGDTLEFIVESDCVVLRRQPDENQPS